MILQNTDYKRPKNKSHVSCIYITYKYIIYVIVYMYYMYVCIYFHPVFFLLLLPHYRVVLYVSSPLLHISQFPLPSEHRLLVTPASPSQPRPQGTFTAGAGPWAPGVCEAPARTGPEVSPPQTPTSRQRPDLPWASVGPSPPPPGGAVTL